MGAWIETAHYLPKASENHSRTLRGCVDWNCLYLRGKISLLKSHPTWVRGLKHMLVLRLFVLCRRTLRGCVDWNFFSQSFLLLSQSRTLRGCVDWNMHANDITEFISVAPYVGAWIETRHHEILYYCITSHPTWVRGLKHLSQYRLKVAQKSHPTWVRGLKPIGMSDRKRFLCRTLRGCVDWNVSYFWRVKRSIL